MNGVTYLTTRDDVDSSRIGVFGSGAPVVETPYAGSPGSRVRCAVVQVPVADGEDWLRQMRREDEWHAFLGKIDVDRVKRVVTGVRGTRFTLREEITVSTLERRTTTVKADVDHRIPDSVSLRSAEAILAYKPIDVVDRIAPRSLMIVAVEGDDVTPTDHSTGLYQRARAPKRLVMQRNTTHYAAYDRYWETVTPLMVDWLSRGLVGGELVAIPRQTRRDRRGRDPQRRDRRRIVNFDRVIIGGKVAMPDGIRPATLAVHEGEWPPSSTPSVKRPTPMMSSMPADTS